MISQSECFIWSYVYSVAECNCIFILLLGVIVMTCFLRTVLLRLHKMQTVIESETLETEDNTYRIQEDPFGRYRFVNFRRQ